MRTVKKEWVQRLGDALKAKFPADYPFQDQDILLGRILWARYLAPVAKHRTVVDSFTVGEWIHCIGRDRRNQRELKRLWESGETHFQGHRIFGGNSEPYLERWGRSFVMQTLIDIEQAFAFEDWREVRKLCGIEESETGPATFPVLEL